MLRIFPLTSPGLRPCLLPVVVCALVGCFSSAADWPAYLHDAQRSGVTDELLPLNPSLAWHHRPDQPPAPAWPEPGVELHRLDFDYAFHPVAADGLVCIASSADDTVRALQLDTGVERWRFCADGPVRFAPHLDGGRCYIAGDDGWVYCLKLADGTVIWQFRAALDGRQLPGNGRLISRWPCRSGVLVLDDVVYVTAGMWPAGGIFVYALDAADGRMLWCNDTSGGRFADYPHPGSVAIGGVSPQGYLLAAADTLLVPTGRAVPAAYDLTSGRFRYHRIRGNRAAGGWRGTIVGDTFYCRTHGNREWQMSTKPEPFGPRAGDGICQYQLTDGETLDAVPERHFVVAAGDRRFLAGNGKVEAQAAGTELWQTNHPRVFAMIRAGNVLVVGGRDTVTALALVDGARAWTAEVDGEARSLAIADGRLLVATSSGSLYCYAAGGNAAVAAATAGAEPPEPSAAGALAGVDLGRLTGGYALVLGDNDEALAATILAQTGLQVIRTCATASATRAAREFWLDRTALYGSRISVQQLPESGNLPWSDFVANLIVVAGPVPQLTAREVYRVLRPCGGMLICPGMTASAAQAWLADAGAIGGELRQEEGRVRLVRGKLPGAMDWDSESTYDQRLAWPLELQWFGGPGPARLPNRHGALLPIPANGRYFVVGNDVLIAVDAYNGVELWSRKFPKLLQRLGILAADDEHVYVNFGDHCLALTAQSGADSAVYRRQPGATDSRPWQALPVHAREPRPLPVAVGDGGSRSHPLDGTDAPVAYQRTYGCGSAIASAGMHFFRSATIGMYDLADDSGIRNFSGVRPGCALTMIPAQGLLIASDGSGGCSCSYNFQTSVVLAPAHQRSNEDWAVFYDPRAAGLTRYAALNLGAPGDRRDENQQLWLGLPRPSSGLQIPCALEVADGLGAFRVNADRVAIAGSRKPWVLASAICGLRRLVLDLEPFSSTVCLQTAAAPVIDGRLADDCWDDQFPLPVNDQESTVFLRYDAENLLLAYRRPAIIDRHGQQTPWRRAVMADDGPIWDDDSCELTLSDRRKERCLHLGMSAAGTRYDGLWQLTEPYPVYEIPRLDVVVDGKADDWGEQGFRVEGMADAKGNMRPRKDFDPTFRLAWQDKGLLLLFEVRDDAVVEYAAQAAMWMKDSIEVFAGEGRHSRNRYHMCIGPGADQRQPAARTFVWDTRPEKGGPAVAAEAVGTATADGYRVEVLLPWQNLGIEPRLGLETALQVLVNDADQAAGGARDWFRVAWHPGGHAGFKPQAMHRLRLSATASAPVRLVRGGKPDKDGLLKSGPALVIPPIDIPQLPAVKIDGELTDWADNGFRQLSLAAQDGTMRTAANFDPSFRLAWDSRGLLFAAEIADDAIVVDPDVSRLWRKDSIEIFVAMPPGSRELVQITIAPHAGAQPTVPAAWIAPKKGKPRAATAEDLDVSSRRTTGGYQVEALVPWSTLGIRAAAAAVVAVQVLCNDADDDGPYPGDWFRAAWYPHGHAGWNPLAYHQVRLVSAASPSVSFVRGEAAGDGLLRAAAPYPWPLPDASTGMTGEDSSWSAAWAGALLADENAFVCELAVPWTTIAAAGIDRESMIIDFSRRGPVTAAPAWSYVPLSLRKTAVSPPRPYTVRLHFAELRDVAAGERVFNVMLQGQQVLNDFDIVAEAGGTQRALSKEFRGILAAKELVLQLESAAAEQTWRSAPQLNAVEIVVED